MNTFLRGVVASLGEPCYYHYGTLGRKPILGIPRADAYAGLFATWPRGKGRVSW
jgi:hypothetical protein